MPTLVTGAGLVGSLVAAQLAAARGDRPILYDLAFQTADLRERLDLTRVTLVDGDVTDQPRLVETMRAHGVDGVVHTAPLLAQAVRQRPADGARVTVLGTLNVLEAARQTAVRRVVFCGSVAVALGLAGRSAADSIAEDFALCTESESPRSGRPSAALGRPNRSPGPARLAAGPGASPAAGSSPDDAGWQGGDESSPGSSPRQNESPAQRSTTGSGKIAPSPSP